MNFLTFDHFFSQDLDALESVLGKNDITTRIPYQRWLRLARKCFPAPAFSGLAAAYDPRHSEAWKAFGRLVRDEVSWLCRVYRPNILLLPSDAIFYVRPFIEEFQSHGVPTFVMQKETTISPLVMDEHSLQISQFVPFMSDLMTVCSERHKQFWIRAGADENRIIVTGQPRFDVYANQRRVRTDSKKRLLFLSYDDVAYLPTDVGQEFDGSWKSLRLQTERELNSASFDWEIIVKEHPQQGFADSALGLNVQKADRFSDTRSLIRDCDVVIAFQTTAIYEAIVCGRPVIYAAWGDVFDKMKSTLNRFEEIEGMVNWARSPEELADLLNRDVDLIPASSQAGFNESIVHLGPINGTASRSTLALIHQVARESDGGAVKLQPLLRSVRNTALIPILITLRWAARSAKMKRSSGVARRLDEYRQSFTELKKITFARRVKHG